MRPMDFVGASIFCITRILRCTKLPSKQESPGFALFLCRYFAVPVGGFTDDGGSTQHNQIKLIASILPQNVAMTGTSRTTR